MGTNELTTVQANASDLNKLGVHQNTMKFSEKSPDSSGNIIGTVVSLMSDNGRLETCWLPSLCEGRYSLGENTERIVLVAQQGQWFATCSSPTFFRTRDNQVASSVEIFNQCLYNVENSGRKCVLYAEESHSYSMAFHNYAVRGNNEIQIGRSRENDIVYDNRYVSKFHASLRYRNGQWLVKDHNSVNGTFVNGKRIYEEQLACGNCLFIMGLRVVLGMGFLSINDRNNLISIQSEKIFRVDSTADFSLPEAAKQGQDDALFNRLPRRRHATPTNVISIEPPPVSLNSDSIPMLLRMGGPMVMSSASLLAGSITAMLSSVLFPVLTQKYTEKQKREYEARRVAKYSQYLREKQIQMEEEKLREESILNKNYPALQEVLTYPKRKSRLWERRPIDDDFLSIRLGYGQRPMLVERDYPPRSFSMDEDPLLHRMYELAERNYDLSNVPILFSFLENRICGVTGERALALTFVKRLVARLVILHSYDEVKLIFLATEEELNQLEFVKYLPHLWNDQKDFRFLAVNQSEASQISEYLQGEVGSDLEKPRDLSLILKERPYYFVLALNKSVFDSMEVLKRVMREEKNCGVSVLTVFDDLPKECVQIFDLKANGKHSIVHLNQIDCDSDLFYLDPCQEESIAKSMLQVSNISLKMATQVHALPKLYTFLEMYSVGLVEYLNSSKRWQENNPVKSLSVPVGINLDGTPFYLDLHEKYQGPHGLVAGMTGSGKSEFIITYILSLAVNFHPDEVAFILIDYKGGGLAGAFEDESRGIHLPHLMGTITNLDGAAIQRSLLSIQSELTRRQKVFNQAKTLTKEGTMDIYSYQNLYRRKKVSEPMPHLFIISDEFAELRKQQPEFMDQLISAARIGRSLGIHLILATQKPVGVVNDQIWSNSKFRVCLRVQDRGDSMEMLKRPDAAELKTTGRFYLQVGYDEFFALGQSAWCGAPYYPQSEVLVQRNDEVQFVDCVGQPLVKKRPAVIRKDSGEKQLMSIVKYLSCLAEQEGICPRSLWKKPLERKIYLEDIKERYGVGLSSAIAATVGLVDDPSRQLQYPLQLNLQETRSVLMVGESGSGKTTFLQTMLYDLVSQYSAEQVQFYILDFSSHILKSFRKLPHCGAVLTEEDEGYFSQLTDLIGQTIAQRKQLFARAEVSSFEAYLKIAPLPLILLVIDQFGMLDHLNTGRDMIQQISDYMKNGSSYGVKLVVTVGNINECPYRMQQSFDTALTLHLKDRYAYANVLNVRCSYEPPEYPGRGMCTSNEECHEYQIALPIEAKNEQESALRLRQKLAQICEASSTRFCAQRIQIADPNERYQDFCDGFSPERIPLGYQMESSKRVAIPLQQLHCASLYFGTQGVVPLVFQNLIYAAVRENMKIFMVKRRKRSVFSDLPLPEAGEITVLECTPTALQGLLDQLQNLFFQRTPIRKAYCTQQGLENWMAPEERKQWRREMRSKTRPVMIFWESLLDVELTLTADQAGMLETYFQMGDGYNIYYWAGHYPEDPTRLQRGKQAVSQAPDITPAQQEERVRELRQITTRISDAYGEQEFALLFGGQYDKQHLLTLPLEFHRITTPFKPEQYGKFLMGYRGKIVSMQMPCGTLQPECQDEDDAAII